MKQLLGITMILCLATAPVYPQSYRVDTNGDGLSDVDNILDAVDTLRLQGTTFDDENPGGHRPALLSDGKYHMACIDLILVCYRAAGYDICSSMNGGKLFSGNPDNFLDFKGPGGKARQITYVTPWLKNSQHFSYFDAYGVSPLDENWIPKEPFQIGDMMFLHYVCDGSHDRHSGIVTEVDPITGRPLRVAQISTYNKNEGLQEVTIDVLFRLWCRRISGYARPKAWTQVSAAAAPEAKAETASLSTTTR